MKQGIIIGAAPGAALSFLKKYRTAEDVIICADGGLQLAQSYGIVPDWFVGDCDSGGYVTEGISFRLFPSEKDWTDLELAVNQALELECDGILLCGCTGGREDHHLSNLALLERLAEEGISARMVDEINEIQALLPGTYTIVNQPAFRYFGLIPLDRQLTGLTISGGKYPLPPTDVHRGSSLTVSNEFLPGTPVEISFRAGNALLVRSVRLT